MIKIFEKLYPGETYVYDRFRWLMNDLINRIEDYFAHEELRKETALKTRFSKKGLARNGYYRGARSASENQIKEIGCACRY